MRCGGADRLRHLQTLYPSRGNDRRAVRYGGDRRHDDPGRHQLAGNVHRSPVAGAYRAGTGEQHRPAIGRLARQGSRGYAQIGTPGLPAVVQLRTTGQPEQFRRCYADENLLHSGNGKLADRHLQRPYQRQTQSQGAPCPEQGVRAGGEDPAHFERGQSLLHAADARQPV